MSVKLSITARDHSTTLLVTEADKIVTEINSLVDRIERIVGFGGNRLPEVARINAELKIRLKQLGEIRSTIEHAIYKEG